MQLHTYTSSGPTYDIDYTITHLFCQVLHYDPFIYKLICCSLLLQKFGREVLPVLKNSLSREHDLCGPIQIKHSCHCLCGLPRKAEKFTISLKVLEHICQISKPVVY